VKRSLALLPLLVLLGCPKEEPVAAVAAPTVDPQAWRATPPTPGPETAWQAPEAQAFALSNGVPVYLVEVPGLPLVTVQVSMAVGRDANPAGKAGMTALAASMLDEGTRTRTGAELAAALADLGAELATYAGGDGSAVTLDALGGDALAPSIALLGEVLRSPRFDKADFNRVKQQTLDQIAADRADPRDTSRRAFSRALYGADHPFGTPVVGDEASVKSIWLADVQKLYQRHWHAGNATVVVVGATTRAEVEPMLEAALGGWQKAKGTRGELPAPATPTATRLVFVEQPGAVQSVVIVGRPAMARTDPAFWPANLAGTLVGGMFGSRLNMNLREEKGWSYGAYGGFSEDRALGVFQARASVQADKTAPAVTEMLKEFEAARRPPTDAELELTRAYLSKGLSGYFETNHSTASAFASVLEQGLPADAWRRYTAELTAVSAAQVGEAARTWLDPQAMLVVVAGPRTIEVEEAGAKKTVDVAAELRALGFAYEEATR
jgi:zinc protease